MKRYIYLVLLALVANIASIRANEPLKREFRGTCSAERTITEPFAHANNHSPAYVVGE